MNSRPNIPVIQADQPAANYIGAELTSSIPAFAHCLRADKAYSQWAYQDIPGYRLPEE
jgi:hypothetical protein